MLTFSLFSGIETTDKYKNLSLKIKLRKKCSTSNFIVKSSQFLLLILQANTQTRICTIEIVYLTRRTLLELNKQEKSV